MRKRYLIATLLLVTAVFFWQLPELLKAMPSRYKGLSLGESDAARANFKKAIAFNPNFLPPIAALNELNG